MTVAAASKQNARPWTTTAIMVLMVPQLVGIFWRFPRHTFGEAGIELRILAVALALFTLLTLAGLWWRRPWALWAVLVVVSFQATVDLCALGRHVDATLALASLVLLAPLTALTFHAGVAPEAGVSPYQRVLFGLVFLFAAWVAAWGLFLPGEISVALPLSAPPMHARFLGAMYLSGSIFMLLGMMAHAWSSVRVVTLMLGLWTGMLGIVSALHLDAFDWLRRPTWFWFVAYIGYPLVALWIAWRQRAQTQSDAGPPVSGLLLIYLNVQGVVALALAVCLLVAPGFMTTVWPWAIPALLAQIYGAPFLSYGVGSLYAARQRTWREVRIAIYGTLVFAVGVLTASLIHAGLFNPRAPSAWLWFGGFAVASLALLAFSIFPSLRTSGHTETA
jgi:hypothetical protein